VKPPNCQNLVSIFLLCVRKEYASFALAFFGEIVCEDACHRKNEAK
jgi:hypothetical protein